MKNTIFLIISLFLFFKINAQDNFCVSPIDMHIIDSKELGEQREYWVSLPIDYKDSLNYPVIYVFDAEWRFGLIRNITFDMGGNNKINKSIVVGIPHVEWEKKRGIDLTFSQSRIEYDGDTVDATWYNDSNSGGGYKFYSYLLKELIPDVNKRYSTNEHETLVGHSYGGYFGGYLLSLDHPFDVIHMYDPSIWFSDGEVITRLKEKKHNKKNVKLHITYQPVPVFHRNKIETLIEELKKIKNFEVSVVRYDDETHNSLFLDSFIKGIQTTNKLENNKNSEQH
ncbi:alpha/beta hydrolase [Aquimarina sp. 2201CG5-10]|uniref:alpha/beta hydrolase n=1 Tax=Aquimarina callyspongiae TaxID=3098150 RepID=UPI002AB56CAC|nr:alpha/beta hydrolase-fold protein [Aquimarina sp. 2201CG5-10]MDY8136177.1 alpha/beta hydrolase-fold protein [Aquimarina sp. 2201CG5-10]